MKCSLKGSAVNRLDGFQQLFDLRTQGACHFSVPHGVGDIGLDEPFLGTAIKCAAFKGETEKILLFGESEHAVGQLDFAACARLLVLQDVKDFRLQDIASADDKV